MEPLYVTLVLALFSVVLGAGAMRLGRAKSRSIALVPTDSTPTASGQVAELQAQVAELQTKFKAHVRDYEDFEEMVRRWQGRVNKQQTRDTREAADAQPSAAERDLEQMEFLKPTNTPPARPSLRRLLRPQPR